MCFASGGGGSTAVAQPTATTPATPPAPPRQVDPVVQQARNDATRRNRTRQGANSTILTRVMQQRSQGRSLSGLRSTTTTAASMVAGGGKTLLGQ